MPRITTEFHLPTPVEFTDVWTEQDNRLYIEPSAIRASAAVGDPWAAAADRQLTNYFGQVMHTVRVGDRRRGVALLERLREPKETRLGMSRVGHAGKGMHTFLADQLWQELHTNPACRQAALVGRIEELAPYVMGIGKDRISDACTRIAFNVLVDFTDAMMSTCRSLGRRVSTAEEPMWDPGRGVWVSRPATLPIATGGRLLLVPTSFVWPRALLNAPSFYLIQSLGRIQRASAVPTYKRGNKPSAPTKKMLARLHRDVRPTNITQAVDALTTDGTNLTKRHTDYVQDRFEGIRLDADGINALLENGPTVTGDGVDEE